MEDSGLHSTWSEYEVDFTCTSVKNDVTSVSVLDHFFVSDGDLVKEAGVIHHVDNSSDHEPIFCIIKSNARILSSVRKDVEEKTTWKLALEDDKN